MYTSAWPIQTEQLELPDQGMVTLPAYPTQPTGVLKGEKFAVNKDTVVKDLLSFCHSATSETLDHDPFMCELNRQGGMWGLGDLGATKLTAAEKKAAAEKKKADAAAKKQQVADDKKKAIERAQETVSLPLVGSVSGSTIYMVVGGAALLVAGSVALWAFTKKG
jgi:hypothetical protein